MAEVFRYEVIPASSWAYLSTILMISLFVKFGRFFSVRTAEEVRKIIESTPQKHEN